MDTRARAARWLEEGGRRIGEEPPAIEAAAGRKTGAGPGRPATGRSRGGGGSAERAALPRGGGDGGRWAGRRTLGRVVRGAWALGARGAKKQRPGLEIISGALNLQNFEQ